MDRTQLGHVVRAVCSHLGLPEVVILGSQAVLGTTDAGGLPPAATRSIEADVAVDPTRLAEHDPALVGVDAEATADEIDGVFGEYSSFHSTFGYYAQGVEVTTAVLPDGWRDRLRPVVVERSGEPSVVGWCLEVHDLWISKAAAARQKDGEFCRTLVDAGWIDRETIEARVATVTPAHAHHVATMIASAFSSPGGADR